MKRMFLLTAVLLVSCNREEQPQAPTAAESERLNEADEMLDELANKEGAAAEATAPPVNSN
jgi:hypothetical protein